jgi:hypothetical protein
MIKYFFTPFLFLLLGCVAYRTKITIAETRDILSQSEKYNVREYASDYYDIAINHINSAENMLKRNRPKEGLASAEAALLKAREAFDTAIRSQAALLLKKARDARGTATANAAQTMHAESFALIENYSKDAEQAYVAGKFEESIRASELALYHSNIISEINKEEVRLKIEQINKKMESFSGSDDENLKIIKNIEEAERLNNLGQYSQALNLLRALDN